MTIQWLIIIQEPVRQPSDIIAKPKQPCHAVNIVHVLLSLWRHTISGNQLLLRYYDHVAAQKINNDQRITLCNVIKIFLCQRETYLVLWSLLAERERGRMCVLCYTETHPEIGEAAFLNYTAL